MKSVIIETMDVLAYMAFGIVLLVGLRLMFDGQLYAAAVFVAVGLFGCSLVFGAWYVLLIASILRKDAKRGRS